MRKSYIITSTPQLKPSLQRNNTSLKFSDAKIEATKEEVGKI